MGMYTAYRFHLALRADTPPEVIDWVRRLTVNDREEIARHSPPLHPFFVTSHWSGIFTGGSGPFHFVQGNSQTALAYNSFMQDPETGTWLLKAAAQTKGIRQDAALLLDWLKEWLIITPKTVLAVARYEEDYAYRHSGYGDWGFPDDKNSDEIDGPYHRQYSLVGGMVMGRTVGGCASEVELPNTFQSWDDFEPLRYSFSTEAVEAVKKWPVEVIFKHMHLFGTHDSTIAPDPYGVDARAVYVGPGSIGTVPVNLMEGTMDLTGLPPGNYTFSVVQPPDPLVFGTHAWFPIFRTGTAALRGKYIHRHKGRSLRRGLPRQR